MSKLSPFLRHISLRLDAPELDDGPKTGSRVEPGELSEGLIR